MPTLLERIARKAFKPLYPSYYRFVWGRSFPMAERLERAVRRWEDLAGRGDTPLGAEAWDAEYASGRWGFLEESAEQPRFDELARRLRQIAPGRSVLDVGCGEGRLAALLGPEAYGRYVGADISAEAIERAASLELPNTSFVAGDAEAWAPTEPFDVIVFGDSLYYFETPIETAERYRRDHLRPGGVVLTAMFATPRSSAIQRRLERAWDVVDRSVVRNDTGEWAVTVFGGPEAE